MAFDFDCFNDQEVQAYVPLHHLEGLGTYSSGETYLIALQKPTINYEVEPIRRGRKCGLALEFTNPTPASRGVFFAMTIEGCTNQGRRLGCTTPIRV